MRNVHERVIPTPVKISDAGMLIDNLAGREDVLWPRERWPSMRFDRPLGVGARGGHGPIRYVVEEYVPGRSVRFRFTSPRGFIGTHRLDLEQVAVDAMRLRHTLEMNLEGLARLSWPLMFRPLHDALIEDALDRAESYLKSPSASIPKRWTWRVQMLRRVARVVA